MHRANVFIDREVEVLIYEMALGIHEEKEGLLNTKTDFAMYNPEDRSLRSPAGHNHNA